MQKDSCGYGENGDVARIHDGMFVYWILEARCWQWGTAGVSFPCQTWPVPEGSQGSTAGHSWAGPLSAAGGTAVERYLRKGKMLHGSKEKIVRNSPASSQAEKEEGGGPPGAGAGISPQPMGNHVGAGICSAALQGG